MVSWLPGARVAPSCGRSFVLEREFGEFVDDAAEAAHIDEAPLHLDEVGVITHERARRAGWMMPFALALHAVKA